MSILGYPNYLVILSEGKTISLIGCFHYTNTIEVSKLILNGIDETLKLLCINLFWSLALLRHKYYNLEYPDQLESVRIIENGIIRDRIICEIQNKEK